MEKRISVVWIEFMRALKMPLRFLQPAHLVQGETQVVVGRRIIRGDVERTAVTRRRALQVAGRLAGIAEILQEFGVGGFETDCPLELGEAAGCVAVLQQVESALVAGCCLRIAGRRARFRHFIPASRRMLSRPWPTLSSRT